MSITDKAKNAALSVVINQALEYLEKDPETNIPKLMGLVDKLVPGDWYKGQRSAFHKAIDEKSNWYQLIMKVYELDPGVRKAFFQNFILNASLLGSATQDETAQREGCNVPWAILLDPTSACNLHCTGCWAAEYGNKLNLTFDELDSIITQGKALGTYMYIFTGGEPLVRKQDVIALCEKHSDCEFLSFTNGTLIDEAFCQEMLRVKNFVPAISLEGFEDANDGRRGQGCYEKVHKAMALLKSHGLPFGISTCYTSANWQDVNSEAYFDQIIDAGALWLIRRLPESGKWPQRKAKLQEQIFFLREASRELFQNGPCCAKVLLLNGVKLFILFSTPWVCMTLLGMTAPSFAQTQMLSALMLLITSALPNVAGLGPTEFAFLLLFSPCVGSAQAALALVLYRVVTYYVPFLASMYAFCTIQRKSM